jgi:hypothetical protein
MKTISLFELLLALFAFYTLFKYDVGIGILVPMLCLFTIFLFERLRQRIKEDEAAKMKLLQYEKEAARKDSFDEIISFE